MICSPVDTDRSGGRHPVRRALARGVHPLPDRKLCDVLFTWAQQNLSGYPIGSG